MKSPKKGAMVKVKKSTTMTAPMSDDDADDMPGNAPGYKRGGAVKKGKKK